jgi:agmatinase
MEKYSFPFLPANFAGLTSPYSDPAFAKVVVVPVPYDSTSEWHGGSRDGPRAIIEASRYLELYDTELDSQICEVGIHTFHEIEPVLSSPEGMAERVYQITKTLVENGKFIVMLGGEHSITLGTVRAFRERFPGLCVLQLDAHADLRDEYLGTRYGHACVMRRVSEYCPLVQVGVRSFSSEEKQFLEHSNIRCFRIEEPDGRLESFEKILDCLRHDVYITIDMDVFDPALMPAVSTPEPGGMQWYQVLTLLKMVARGRHVVGFDLVELCPREGPAHCAFLAAKLAYKLIGYALLK